MPHSHSASSTTQFTASPTCLPSAPYRRSPRLAGFDREPSSRHWPARRQSTLPALHPSSSRGPLHLRPLTSRPLHPLDIQIQRTPPVQDAEVLLHWLNQTIRRGTAFDDKPVSVEGVKEPGPFQRLDKFLKIGCCSWQTMWKQGGEENPGLQGGQWATRTNSPMSGLGCQLAQVTMGDGGRGERRRHWRYVLSFSLVYIDMEDLASESCLQGSDTIEFAVRRARVELAFIGHGLWRARRHGSGK